MIVVDATMTMAFELLWLYTGQVYRCPSVTQKGPLFDQSLCASVGSSNPKLWYLRAFTNRDTMDEPCRTLQRCYASVVRRKKLSVKETENHRTANTFFWDQKVYLFLDFTHMKITYGKCENKRLL